MLWNRLHQLVRVCVCVCVCVCACACACACACVCAYLEYSVCFLNHSSLVRRQVNNTVGSVEQREMECEDDTVFKPTKYSDLTT